MFDYSLLMEYQQTRDLNLRNKLIEQQIPLVHHVAHRVYKSIGNEQEYDDIASYGVFGLIQAIERFDCTRNVKFSTYAVPRIHGSILDELRRLDWVPRSVRKKIKDAQEDIYAAKQLFDDVDEYAIARKHGLGIREYNILVNDYMCSIADCFPQFC